MLKQVQQDAEYTFSVTLNLFQGLFRDVLMGLPMIPCWHDEVAGKCSTIPWSGQAAGRLSFTYGLYSQAMGR